VVLDSPTNNFCTLNPINPEGDAPLSDGNLVVGSTTDNYALGTVLIPSTGKWYFEGTVEQVSLVAIGIQMADAQVPDGAPSRDENIVYGSNGSLYGPNDTSVAYGGSYTVNDVIGVAVNMDDGEMTFYKNNVSQGTLDSTDFTYDIRDYDWVAKYACYNGDGRLRANFGQSGFTYTPPTDYLALSTSNLPEPTISPADDASPEDYFGTLLWTGDNTSGRTIATGETGVTGDVNFTPDWVWIKGRSDATNHLLTDVIRGGTAQLRSNLTSAESQFGDVDLTFTDGGFTNAGSASNESGRTFVAWNWKANGSGVSNTDGSITSQVSANTESGFSIVSYTGTGSAATIGHGLDSAPEMVIYKCRNVSTQWPVYAESVGATKVTFLDGTGASATSSVFNNTAPSSSALSLGSDGDANGSGRTYIAYCFHSVEGFSKFGSYTGNGSADGPFVFCGFRPAFVLIKNISRSGPFWIAQDSKRDPFNTTTKSLSPNSSNAESDASDNAIDFLSNGFKHRDNNGSHNESGSDYIYMAFAENPFKYSNAR